VHVHLSKIQQLLHCSSMKEKPSRLFFPIFFLFWKLAGIYFLAINTCLPKSTTSSQSASHCDGYYPYMSIWYPEDGLVEFFRRVEHKFFITHAFVSIKEQSTLPVLPVYVSMVSVICPYQWLILSQRTNIFSPDFTALMGLYFLKALFYIQQLQ